MSHLIIAVMLALSLTACVQQVGTRFDASKIASLQPGISTEKDAINMLGPPAAVSNYPDGSQLLQWQYVYGTSFGGSGGAHAAILFGVDHKMIRVTHLSQQ